MEFFFSYKFIAMIVFLSSVHTLPFFLTVSYCVCSTFPFNPWPSSLTLSDQMVALKHLQHPNVVRLRNVFPRANAVVLVMDFCWTDLSSVLGVRERLKTARKEMGYSRHLYH